MEEPKGETWRVLQDVVRDLSNIEAAKALCNVLYSYDFVIRSRNGSLVTEGASMRVASWYVEKLFKGKRPGLRRMVSRGYEYAYWLRFFDPEPSDEEQQLMNMWLQRLSEHPDVLEIRRVD